MMRAYYELIKPGIVYGNAMTAIAAFVFASNIAMPRWHVDFALLAATVIGLSLSIAGACVVNNIIDRDIDTRMERTKDRAIPTGIVPLRDALAFALILEACGLALLYFRTNSYAFAATLIGAVVYLALYTPAKRLTRHSTLIGAFSGAVPPVVGYAAVAGAFDATALLLFLILICWQMAHFFAISIFRKSDYAAASLPVMAVSSGIPATKALIAIYTMLFTACALLLPFVTPAHARYFVPVGIVSLGWVASALLGYRRAADDRRWSRTVFFISIAVLLVFSAALALA